MTQEQIEQKALAVYPKKGGTCLTAFGKFEYDNNAPKREGYIRALTDVQNEIDLNSYYNGRSAAEQEYESLPKIKGKVYMDFSNPADIINRRLSVKQQELEDALLKLEMTGSEIEVELIIRKV